MTVKESKVEKSKKVIKKEPTPAAILKKVATITDSNKALQKEIKTMSKIFGDNQKILVSMKEMIDTLTGTLETMQRQAKQIDILEDDTQKLYAGFTQVRGHSDMIKKINEHTTRLQQEVFKINELQKSAPKAQDLSRQVEDSMNAMRNNSQMIIKIAQRIDEVREDLRKVSGKTDSLSEIGKEIDNLKNNIHEIINQSGSSMETSIQTRLNQELLKIKGEVESAKKVFLEIENIKNVINDIAVKSSKIDSLEGVIEELKQEFFTITTNVESASNLSMNSIKEISGKIDKIETEITSLTQRADSTAFVGEGLRSAQQDFSNFKINIYEKTNTIEQKIATVSDVLKQQDVSTREFHRKTEKIFEEMQLIKKDTNEVSKKSSNEIMALLKLSEYQSNIRIHSESKYGDIKALEGMAQQTMEIVNLFDRLSIHEGEKIQLPHEVKQWAISKILDCADKWEVRFGDVFAILVKITGKELLKESIRIQQIRDIYGIRAVDEIRSELNIS